MIIGLGLMSIKPIATVILKAAEGKFNLGESFRLRHEACTDKTKDPAMTVTRATNGWAYYCHRCGLGGMVWDESLNPDQTKARINALHAKPNKVTEHVTLPMDFEPMIEAGTFDFRGECPVPYEAWHWFWKYSMLSEDIVKYNCGWSNNYKRVIIPLYEYARLGDELARKLVGWVGREVKYNTKEERNAAGVSKYMTRARKGKRRYFVAPGEEGTVVITEDCISAMRVNIATGYTATALLNTSVSNDMMSWLRGKIAYLWLDGDMLASSMKQVQRMRGLGLKAKHIHTPKDPKEYNSLAIRATLRGETV